MNGAQARAKTAAPHVSALSRPQGWDAVNFVAWKIIPLMPVVALLGAIRLFAVNVPFGEDWELVPLVVVLRNGTASLAALWTQFYQGPFTPSKLIVAFLAQVTHFDVTVPMYAG